MILVYFYTLIKKSLPKIFRHSPFSTENFICDVGKIRKCVTTRKDLACRVKTVQLRDSATPKVSR